MRYLIAHMRYCLVSIISTAGELNTLHWLFWDPGAKRLIPSHGTVDAKSMITQWQI